MEKRSVDTMIIVFLGSIAVVCINGIVILSAFAPKGTSTDALQTIASLSVGALASRVAHVATRRPDEVVQDSDAFEIIGRAATRQVVADALRGMDDPVR